MRVLPHYTENGMKKKEEADVLNLISFSPSLP